MSIEYGNIYDVRGYDKGEYSHYLYMPTNFEDKTFFFHDYLVWHEAGGPRGFFVPVQDSIPTDKDKVYVYKELTNW